MLSLVLVTPGGVGVPETGCVALLVALGGDPATSAAGVLLYRLFTYLLEIPVGGLGIAWWVSRGKAHAELTPTPSGGGAHMKIVHVTDVYLPRLGGIELHVHDLAEQQRRRGHDVVVLTGTGAGAQEHCESDGVPVIRLGRMAWARPLPQVLADADVVHCHSSIVSPLAWASARSAGRLGIPVVVTMHSVIQQSTVVRDGLRTVVAAAGPGVTWAAVSEVAARTLQPLVPRPVLVLPTGSIPMTGGPRPHGREPPART